MHKYTIRVKNLTFETIIGLLERERIEKQPVVIDVKITYTKQGESFIDYAEVTALIEKRMQEGKFLLIEDALDILVSEIKAKFSLISSINMKISKPEILDNCEVSVEIFKKY